MKKQEAASAMRNLTSLLLFVLVLLSATVVFGQQRIGSEVSSYAFYNSSGPRNLLPVYEGGPKKWSAGVDARRQERDMDYEGRHTSTRWRITEVLGFIQYDPLPWLTLHGALGGSDLGDIAGQDYDWRREWDLGVRFRILDYLLPEVGYPFPLPYYFRIEGRIDYSDSMSKSAVSSVTWNEIFATITAGLATRPEKNWPVEHNSVGFYVGPAFSSIDGKEEFTDETVDISEVQDIGPLAGLRIVFSDYMSFQAEWQYFKHSTVAGTFTIHF